MLRIVAAPSYEEADHADEGEVVEREILVAGRDRAWLLQRRLLVWIALATLLTWAVVIADLERGGRPDPPTLRAAAILLDGHWRFRTGDFGIGVSRTQYLYAILIPLLASLIVRTLGDQK